MIPTIYLSLAVLLAQFAHALPGVSLVQRQLPADVPACVPLCINIEFQNAAESTECDPQDLSCNCGVRSKSSLLWVPIADLL